MMAIEDAATLPALARRRWFVVIPLLGLAMFMLNLDRTNISLLLAPITKELGLSLASAGLVSSILFIGSVIFQIPLAVLVSKCGGRYVLAGCLLIWGLASAAGGIAGSEGQLLAARFVVGIGESAFHPLMYVLIAFWFVARERGRANTRFFMFSFAASVLTAPVTGFLLEYVSWRSVLIIQGLPAAVLGLIWLLVYDDRPTNVFWLSKTSAENIERAVLEEKKATTEVAQVSFRRALLNRRLVPLMLIYGLLGGGGSAIPLWLPTIVRTFGGSRGPLVIGLLSGLPFLVGAIVGVILGVFADRSGRYRALMLIPLSIGAVALLVGPLAAGHPVIQLVLLCVVVAGAQSAVPLFYAFPSWMLSKSVLTIGITLVNLTGTLFAFFATYLVGWVGGMTTPAIGFATLGIVLAAAAVIGAVTLREPEAIRRPGQPSPELPTSQAAEPQY